MKFDMLTAGLRFNDGMVGEVVKEKHFFSVMVEKEAEDYYQDFIFRHPQKVFGIFCPLSSARLHLSDRTCLPPRLTRLTRT